MFLVIHAREGDEDEQSRALPYFVLCWVTRKNPHPRDKHGFERSVIYW